MVLSRDSISLLGQFLACIPRKCLWLLCYHSRSALDSAHLEPGRSLAGHCEVADDRKADNGGDLTLPFSISSVLDLNSRSSRS